MSENICYSGNWFGDSLSACANSQCIQRDCYKQRGWISEEQRTLVEIFKDQLDMDLMIVVLKGIHLPSVEDTSKDIVKDGMTHQRTIHEVRPLTNC
jgi:hypothetical protein